MPLTYKANRKVHKLAFFFWLGLTAFLCLSPGNDQPPLFWFDGLDKLVHFILFFVLCFLGGLAYGVYKKNLLVGLFLSAVFFEGAQMYIPLRSFEIVDLAMNFFGVLFGGIIHAVVCKPKSAFFK